MIFLLKKIKSILPDRYKSTGLKEKIADFFHPKLSKIIGSLERAYEVILFIPVIYKCVRWDHYSIYYILRHWFKRMEEVQRNDSYHVGADRYADQLKLCGLLLNRLIADDYHENVYGPHDEKWGKSEYNFEPCKNKEGYSSLIITRKNCNSKEEIEQEKKEYKGLMDKVVYLENQDIELLFETIKKRHRNWWT